MPIRTHLGRPMDFTLVSNRLIAVVAGAVAAASVVLWMVEGDISVLWSAGHAFLAWAVLREIDPDHPWTAAAASIAAGAWSLTEFEIVSLLPVAGLLLAARLISNSTGRRPLPIDFVVVGALAVAISFTSIGFLAGFGVAIGFYVDDRMAEEQNQMAILTAGLTAVGATIVATAAGAFPSRLPDLRPLLVVSIGVLALIAIFREPETPISLVDSRRKTPIRADRLHGARTLLGVLLFVSALVAGSEVMSLVPLAVTFLLALVSNEVERLRRRQ